MRILKKYGNRRLYDTGASRYVNLVEVAAIVRAGEDLRVEDVRDGADLTCVTLLQALLEDGDAAHAIPVSLLHRVMREGTTATGRARLHAELERANRIATGDPVEPTMAPATDWEDAWLVWTGETRLAPGTRARPDEADALGGLRARLAALEERLR